MDPKLVIQRSEEKFLIGLPSNSNIVLSADSVVSNFKIKHWSFNWGIYHRWCLFNLKGFSLILYVDNKNKDIIKLINYQLNEIVSKYIS